MEDTNEKPKGSNLLINIYKVLRLMWGQSKSFLFWKFIFSLVNTILPVVASWYLALLINKISSGTVYSVFDPFVLKVILVYLALLVVNPLTALFYTYMNTIFFIYFVQAFDILFIKKRAEIDIQKYEDPKFNDLVTKVNENYYKIVAFSDVLIGVLQNLAAAIIAVVVLVHYKWWIGVSIFIALIPSMVKQFGGFGEPKLK